jgi:hypothetical protein
MTERLIDLAIECWTFIPKKETWAGYAEKVQHFVAGAITLWRTPAETTMGQCCDGNGGRFPDRKEETFQHRNLCLGPSLRRTVETPQTICEILSQATDGGACPRLIRNRG